MPPECQLFGTLGCHLCELAEAILMPLVEHGLMVELVDIADHLLQKYFNKNWPGHFKNGKFLRAFGVFYCGHDCAPYFNTAPVLADVTSAA